MQSLSNVEKGGTIVSRNALPINAMPPIFRFKKGRLSGKFTPRVSLFLFQERGTHVRPIIFNDADQL